MGHSLFLFDIAKKFFLYDREFTAKMEI